MKKIILVFFCLFLFFKLSAQRNITGFVYSKENGEALPFVHIQINEQHLISNESGYFFWPNSNERVIDLKCDFIGFEKLNDTFQMDRDTTLIIHLQEKLYEINEISIEAEGVHRNKLNAKFISPKEMLLLPMTFGENDVIKGMQQQAGIKTLGEGNSGIYVRGGNIDNNLILFDGIPVYNMSHMMGFVSIFNPDVVRGLSIYKGFLPAKYGGRLSSVINVHQNAGNLNKVAYSGGINAFSSKLSVQGPLTINNSSFLISLRKSLIDVFANPGESYSFIPGFYDLNIKLRKTFQDKSQLVISSYIGKDKVELNTGLENNWGNVVLSGSYIFTIRNHIFSNISLSLYSYKNYFANNAIENNMTWQTGLKNINLKWNIDQKLNNQHSINYGITSTYYFFKPGESNLTEFSIYNSQAIETFGYGEYHFQHNNILDIKLGIRLVHFANAGNVQYFTYDVANETPPELNQNKNGLFNHNILLEPSCQILLNFSEYINLDIGLGKNSQFMQLMQNNELPYTTLETWMPSSPNIEPQQAYSCNLGLSGKIGTIDYNTTGYYNHLINQLDFIDHATLINNPYVEQEIRKGIGKTYGIETELRKSKGKFTTSLSYTWSRSYKKIREINNYNWYASTYDMPNDIKINISYRKNAKIGYNVYWLFYSGRPYTLPTGFYAIGNRSVTLYSDRNAGRMPDYHRLDANITIDFNHKSDFESRLTLGVYNLYARKNPLDYRYSFSTSPYVKPKVYQFNFINIFPNVAYTFSF